MKEKAGHELLLSSITKYFNQHPANLEIFVNILTGKSNLSLRLLDWLVTHYSKKYNTTYWIHGNNIYESVNWNVNGDLKEECKRYKKINLHEDYRAQLKSYTKLYFDPFRRHNRITYVIDENRNIETTIAQLNFFRWIFKNNVLQYVNRYNDCIVKDMTSTVNKKQNKKLQQHISHSPCYILFD